MSFIEQFSSKSKDITQKAKDMTEQKKLKNLIKQETLKISALYETIGKLYYENEADNAKEPFTDLVHTIKLSQEKSTEYQAKLNELKSKYICPHCGATITSTTQFCKVCGTKISNFTKC